jgi:hypothetical protein
MPVEFGRAQHRDEHEAAQRHTLQKRRREPGRAHRQGTAIGQPGASGSQPSTEQRINGACRTLT